MSREILVIGNVISNLLCPIFNTSIWTYSTAPSSRRFTSSDTWMGFGRKLDIPTTLHLFHHRFILELVKRGIQFINFKVSVDGFCII